MRSIVIAALVAFVGVAQARAEDDRFRLYFKTGTAEPITIGAEGERNARAVGAIASLLASWPPGTGARFLFVAPKASVCAGVATCDPDQMLSQRTRVAMTTIRAKKSGARFPTPGENAIEAVTKGVTLPTGAHATIDLRLYVPPSNTDAQTCPWPITLFDRALPPIVSAGGPLTALPIGSGATLPLSPTAEVKVGTGARVETSHIVVWETENGGFCVTERTANGSLVVPAGALQLLHVVSATGRSAREQELRKAPVCSTRRDTRTVASNSRGVGDNVRKTPDGSIRPVAVQAGICSFPVAMMGDM